MAARRRFDPKQKTGPDACPYNYLYWRFIDEHAERFASNPRMRTVVNAWLARSEANKEPVRESASAFLGEHVPVSAEIAAALLRLAEERGEKTFCPSERR